jgi:molybdate transport system regulatory protein
VRGRLGDLLKKMNRFMGTVVSVDSSGEISLAQIRVGKDVVVSALVIESPELSPFLREGKEVSVLFKESEVMLVKGDAGGISVTNRIPARVVRIGERALLSEIGLVHEEVPLRALITTRASRELKLAVGDRVTALVNPAEITLAEGP